MCPPPFFFGTRPGSLYQAPPGPSCEPQPGEVSSDMFDRVADYIHIERGIIPPEACGKALEFAGSNAWQPNIWYDHKLQKTYSEEALEADMLFASAEMNELLFPAIDQAAKRYVQKFAYMDSPRTTQIISRLSTIRFNRYAPGQIMRKHHDHIHAIFDGKERGIPVLSFVGNLNDDYAGGELAFFDGGTKFTLGAGDICMFPSCFLYPHEVLPVTRGERISFAMWGW